MQKEFYILCIIIMEYFLRITDIVTRSNEGVTEPFICGCEDGNIYYVKGNSAGSESLRNEWIAGSIAKYLKLPIPEFKILYVHEDLIKYSARDDIRDLGSGYVFGSQKAGDNIIPYNRAITIGDHSIKQCLLLFDWWIHNDDRWLGEGQGNPNLFWNVETSKLVVLDHNLAFDIKFDAETFWQKHVFANSQNIFTETFISEYELLLEHILNKVNVMFDDIPEEWYPLDDYDQYKGKVLEVLSRFKTNPNKFWRKD